jgi:hypothetical protein
MVPRGMKKILWVAASSVAMVGTGSSAGTFPEAEISNGVIRARLCLPDGQAGYYRGTRFDWSGVILDLEYAGHNYYPQWFQRMDPGVHDFVYVGPDIVAGPCTAITGPAEEFASPLGFEETKAGGTFVKVGVGVLRKPDQSKYDAFHLYQVADGGQWEVRRSPEAVEFIQVLSDPASGYGYRYTKRASLAKDRARLDLEHSLQNTGKRPIQTSVYNHNFLYLDRRAPHAELSITLPFAIQATPTPDKALAEIRGKQLRFGKTLSGEDRVYFTIQGYGSEPRDYDIRVEDRKHQAGVRITADRPLARMALWAIRAPVSIEPFIDVNVEPGGECKWRISYDYYAGKDWSARPAAGGHERR